MLDRMCNESPCSPSTGVYSQAEGSNRTNAPKETECGRTGLAMFCLSTGGPMGMFDIVIVEFPLPDAGAFIVKLTFRRRAAATSA